jgi:hypothetical protein
VRFEFTTTPYTCLQFNLSWKLYYLMKHWLEKVELLKLLWWPRRLVRSLRTSLSCSRAGAIIYHALQCPSRCPCCSAVPISLTAATPWPSLQRRPELPRCSAVPISLAAATSIAIVVALAALRWSLWSRCRGGLAYKYVPPIFDNNSASSRTTTASVRVKN